MKKVENKEIEKKSQILDGINLAKLVTPKIPNFKVPYFDIDKVSSLSRLVQEINSTVLGQRSSEIELKMIEVSNLIQSQYAPQITFMKDFTAKLQDTNSPLSKLAEAISIVSEINTSPIFKSLETIKSFSTLRWYESAYLEFGGTVKPENLNEYSINQIFKENNEIIEEIKEVIITAEKGGATLESIPEILFSFISKKIPLVDHKIFSILVLIVSSILTGYSLYSNFTTNKAIDEIIIPGLQDQSEQLVEIQQQNQDIKDLQLKNSVSIKDNKEVLDSEKKEIDSLKTKFEQFEKETGDYLEKIILEMKKDDRK